MAQHRYSKIPKDEKPSNTEPPSLWSRVTYGWVTGILSTSDQHSDISLAPGQRSAWWSSRNIRQAWLNRARAAVLRERDPRVWSAVLVSVPLKDYIGLFAVLGLIVLFRLLQAAFFAALFYYQPFLVYGSRVPWFAFNAVGFWLSVCMEAFGRGHYSYFAHLISASVKTGITGLVFDKVLHLKDPSQADFTHSHMMNLVSKDLELIGQCINLVPFLLTAPIELAAFCTILTVMIGWEGITGILYMLICTMLRCGMGRVYRKLRRHTAYFTHQRLLLLTEIFSGIRAVKMNVWEPVFENLVKTVRRKELFYIKRKIAVLGAVLSVEHAVPIIGSLISMATLMLREKELTTMNVFLVLLTMYILNASCGDSFVRGIEVLIATLARLERVERFLLTDFPLRSFFERKNSSRTNSRTDAPRDSRTDTGLVGEYRPPWLPPLPHPPRLSLSGVCCEREYDLTDIELNFINLSCAGDELVAFTGPPVTGAGTSLLFDAILEEVPLIRGQIVADGKVAYVGQKPWIFSGTLRENILFGEPYRSERFLAVIKACKLERDIKILPRGDLTIIGAHGIKLTRSQRERICLARAAFSDATIILLDNPLEHVDTALANQIFDECIKGLLAQRLRLVITRRRDFLEKSPRVLLMADGVILREGTFSKLLESGEDLPWMIVDGSHEHEEQEKLEAPNQTLSESEEKVVGCAEGFGQYSHYLTQAGSLPLLLLGGVLLIAAPGGVLATIGILFARAVNMPREHQQQQTHIQLITSLVGVFLLVLLIRAFFLLAIGIKCSTRVHERSVFALLRAPINVFDLTSEDKFVSVFSKDMECLDEKLPPASERFFQSVVEHATAAVVTKVAAPWTILAFVPAAILSIFIGRYYLRLARKARSLESSSLKPVLTHLSESMLGVVTVRACRKESHVLKEFYRLQNQHAAAGLMRSAAEQWLAVRHLAVMSVFMCLVTVIAIYTTNGALAALLLTFDRQLVVGIALVPLLFTEIEHHMHSAARLMRYVSIQPEPGYDNGTKPPEDWPSEGAVSISDALLANSRRRRASFQTMTLGISAGEKICITGEIGSGKSSFVSALLRLPEPQGEVIVDGVSLKSLGLQEARGAFSVLQRKPFVFTASLRCNLDPEGVHDDRDLWSSLEAVKMKTEVEGLTGQLDFPMTQPCFFSKAQQQLISIARALLQKKNIIILDGFLSDVDLGTFRKIHDVIEQQLSDCTVITVPDGLTSVDMVLYHDRMVILEQGRIVEMGSPQVLLEQQNSLLSRLLHYYRDI